MSDNWLALSEAYRRLLVLEEDDAELLERMLLPELWSGAIPAVGRRAFVEGEMRSDVPVTTINDWHGWPEENPVIFDWAQSRALSPRGFVKPDRTAADVRLPRIEFYRIKVSNIAIISIWPEFDSVLIDATKVDPFQSGGAGRPSGMNQIKSELNRLYNNGNKYKTKTELADVLVDWYMQKYGTNGPNISAKTILNSLGGDMGRLLQSATKPLPKL